MGVYYPVKPADTFRWPLLASGEETLPRQLVGTAGVTVPTGRVRLSYFVARKSESITSVRTITNTIAVNGTPTLCKVGVYSIDKSTYNATLVTSTANTTSLWAAVNTEYTTALTAPLAKVAGQIYAFAIAFVMSGGTTPTLCGWVCPAGLGNTGACTNVRGIPVGGYVTASDLPATIAHASLVGSQYHPYGELVP